MKIIVFGANGKVGSMIVANLLADGHSVRAFVHSKSRLSPHPKLRIVTGDIHSKSDVEKAINGTDAVVSALGSWGTKSKDILSTGMELIIPAMKSASLTRIVSLTGAGAYDALDRPTLFDKLNRRLFMLVAKKILQDGEKHIALLRASELDWTVVRSPAMLGGKGAGYKLTFKAPPPWAIIKRDDVAVPMTSLVLNKDYSQSAPFIVQN